MGENVLGAQKRLEEQIDGIKISNDQKDKMKRILKGIVESQRGRLFTKKTDEFEEYLTLRQNEDSKYELCVIERMINRYSGATEARNKKPMSLFEVAEYIKENEGVLESEVVNAENYQRRLQAQEQPVVIKEDKLKTPQEDFKDIIIATIENLPNVPEHKKQRAIDVLETIAVSPQNKLLSKKEDGYSESIALRGGGREFRYYVVKRMSDFSGTTQGREYEPLGAKSLLEYIDQNRITIDKEIQKMRQLHPELKPENKRKVKDEECR